MNNERSNRSNAIRRWRSWLSWQSVAGVVIATALVSGGRWCWLWWGSSDPGGPSSGAAAGYPGDGPRFDAQRAIKGLEDAGWEQPAAKAVISLNESFLAVVTETSEQECDAILARLSRLGDPQHAYARKRIESVPKLAGLMANTLDNASDGPEMVAAALGPEGDAHAESLIALFALSATGEDAVALARVINRDRDLAKRLADLQESNLLSWLEPKDMGNDEASSVYRSWARRIIADAIETNADEGAEEAFAILSMHGERVAQRVRADSAFRSDLMSRVYPAYRRVVMAVDDDGFSREVYYMYPQTWEFIHQFPKDAENLLVRVGPVAVDVLMDAQFSECQDSLVDVLLTGDQQVIDGLLDERVCKNPRFVDFLERGLPSKTRVAAIQKLVESPERANRYLEEWSAMTEGGVIDELGEPATGVVTWLPGYSAAVLARKIAQGRRVTGMDVAFAAIDAAEVVLLSKGGGAALKAVAASARKSATNKIGSNGLEQLAKAESRNLAPWLMRGAQKAGREMLSSVRERLVIDVTPIMRGLHKRCGINMKTFQYIDRLNPKIFMRKDRRVVFDLLGNHPLNRFMNETAKNAGVENVMESEAALAAGRVAFEEGSKAVEAANRNMSAWWLMVGDGLVDRLATVNAAQ